MIKVAELTGRAVIAMGGADWRDFLQGLVTQDVATLAPGEVRFAGLLSPPGRLLFDLFLVGLADGCLIDCVAEQRDALLARLRMYRLRARVDIEPSDKPVRALWGVEVAGPQWSADPRLPALGFRGYGAPLPPGTREATQSAYDSWRLGLGVPGPDDWGVDATYPIEANFDLLRGIDFKKGCFVGQETTSRMKRRGAIKNRMVPIRFEGSAPAFGSELLCETLRAGRALSGAEGVAIALLRLDRLDGDPLTLADGRPWRPDWPPWMSGTLAGA